MYEDIIRLLDNKRLKEALDKLEALVAKAENWEMGSEVERLKTTYGYMLQYASQGVKDPGRNEMYRGLCRRAYELASQASFSQSCKTGSKHISYKYQNFKRVPPHTYGELCMMLESVTEEAGMLTLAINNEEEQRKQQKDLALRREKAIDELFDRTWVSDGWTEEEYKEAGDFLRSVLVPENDIAVLVSAVTLNLLEVFDVRKLQFLLEACMVRKEAVIRQRALVGIVLTFPLYADWIVMYPELTSALKAFEENHEIVDRLHNILIILLLSRETEKIDKKMREEIIPEMLKNPKLNKTDFKVSDLEDLEDLNPEWESGMEKVSEKIRELGEWQMEGADTYMGTFAPLKHYPFFRQASHWFYPFDKWVPEIASTFSDGQIDDRSFLGVLLQMPFICNSDKFSVCLVMNSVPEEQRQMLTMQLGGQDDMLKETFNGQKAISTENGLAQAVSRQYIYDLYRFFKLWMFRHEQRDLFAVHQDYWNCPLLRPLFLKDKYQRKLADYLFSKGYYEEAAQLYGEMVDAADGAGDAELWQKLGFSLQKGRRYDKAIRVYKHADVLKPNHSWTLKHLAQCCKRVGDYESAVNYFCMVEQMQPENLHVLTQIGQCMAKNGQYKEALSYFFKVEYLNEVPVGAWRAIAWCYFMTGKPEDALRFYDKLQKTEDMQATDWLNSGHVYLVQGNWVEAVRCYRKAKDLCDSSDSFFTLYHADREVLLQQGISDTDICLIPDLLDAAY